MRGISTTPPRRRSFRPPRAPERECAVRKEREFVESLKGRKVHRIDLGWPWPEQMNVIQDALHSATTFVSYASRDEDRVRPYIELLQKNDFALFDFTLPSTGSGPSWTQ